MTSGRSVSRSTASFQRYVDEIGACTWTHAARRSSTSVLASASARASSGIVVRITMRSVISLRFHSCTSCEVGVTFRRVTKADAGNPRKRQASKAKRASRSRRMVSLLLIVVAGAIIVDGLVGERGLLAMLRARHEYEVLSTTIERKKADNARLREEARRLKDDPSAIEEVARRELGLIRPGERVFIVKDVPPAKQ